MASMETSSETKQELQFWESQQRNGDEADLKMARDLPDDTPQFILAALAQFERDAVDFCFGDAKGRVLDAGCGNGNLLTGALKKDGDGRGSTNATRFVGMDFSANMLHRAAARANGPRTEFLQGIVNRLPFQDQSFDWVVSSGVLTCLSSVQEAADALTEFHRVLKPDGVLVVDFFNCHSHFTLLRKYFKREPINPPEYVSPTGFTRGLEDAGFQVIARRGFDFKPCQGYLFMSRLRPLVDPCFVQEKFSRFLEAKVVPRHPELIRLGYRIYVKCRRI